MVPIYSRIHMTIFFAALMDVTFFATQNMMHLDLSAKIGSWANINFVVCVIASILIGLESLRFI